MLIEMHCHTSRYSACSIIDPVAMVKRVMRKNLQGMILTEHHYLWSPDEIAKLREEAETEDYFVILPAQEVSTDIGHILVYGAERTITEEMSLRELRNTFPEAALIWAHPLRYGKVPGRDDLLNPLLDGIEIFNTNQTPLENYHGLKLWHEHKFIAISGSDAHAEDTAGMLPTLFDHPVKNIGDLLWEIKSGRCRPFYKEIPKRGGNITAIEITLGTKGDPEARSRIVLKTTESSRKWAKAKRTSHLAQYIYDHGFSEGKFRRPQTLEINNDEMLIIEEGQRGKSFFDLMGQVNPSIADSYLRLAAEWLAYLHGKGITIGNTDVAIKRERHRFRSYLKAFISTKSPYLSQAEKLIKVVEKYEEDIIISRRNSFIQIHGDYHPKNIIIGQDRMQDISTLFISVIDFENSMRFVPAFDIGYFISQFSYQFRIFPHITERHRPEDFIKYYLDASGKMDDLAKEVNLFRIRANISIASYLIKLGKGESADMDWIISQSMSLLRKHGGSG